MNKSFMAILLSFVVITYGYAQDDSQSSVSDSLSPVLSEQAEDSVIEQEIGDFITEQSSNAVETTSFQDESSPITQSPIPGVPTPINGKPVNSNPTTNSTTPFISGELNTIAPGVNPMPTPFIQPGCINGNTFGPTSNPVSYPINAVPTPIHPGQPMPASQPAFSVPVSNSIPVNNFAAPTFGNIAPEPAFNNFAAPQFNVQCCPQYSRGFRGRFFRRVR